MSTDRRKDTPREKGVEIPYGSLSDDALHGLVSEFVTRSGTDYGLTEKTLDQKIRDVKRQLTRGEAKIVWDAITETANIVPAR